MQEHLLNLPSYHTDVLIVGGGIVGAGALRDLALHGINSVLIEKKEFSSQTSSKSSKMLHGGIRYLENLDFDLVFEALHEKNLWIKIAPEYATETSFIFPVYEDSPLTMLKLKAGLFLYDLLSSFQNSPHSMLSKEETLKRMPHLNPKGLKGAGVYYDAIMDDKKLTLAVMNDALKHSCVKAYEYTSLVDLYPADVGVVARIKDETTQKERLVFAKKVIMALGPFTDQVMKTLSWPMTEWKDKLLPSKGSHLWVKKDLINIKEAVVMTANDGRVIFVIPHEDKVLVGTTEEVVGDNYFDIKPSEKEIQYLIDYLKHYFPNVTLTEDAIIESFSGIRPLVKDDSATNAHTTAREHKVLRPHKDIYSIIGGKYTTFRVMVQETVREIATDFGVSYSSERTKRPLI